MNGEKGPENSTPFISEAPFGPPKLELVPPLPEQISDPPSGTLEQLAAAREAEAARQQAAILAGQETAAHIATTQPEFTPTTEAPSEAVVRVGEPPAGTLEEIEARKQAWASEVAASATAGQETAAHIAATQPVEYTPQVAVDAAKSFNEPAEQ